MDIIIFVALIFLLLITLNGGSNNYSVSPDITLEDIEKLADKIIEASLRPVLWIANKISKITSLKQ